MAYHNCCWAFYHVNKIVAIIYLKIGVFNIDSEVNRQTEANKRWQEKNRDKARYLRNRSAARNFIKKDATNEDIAELEELIRERKKANNTKI